MGVTGLWTVLQPCARPIKIETLNKKRLAVDASIWIYQFLKAVRDKEGNALRNSHIVGFFRRICKLLFFGIKPVFVFDGGAPALKRQTINNRKQRREGRREDAVRTAGKILALQMQRIAEEEERKRKEVRRHPRQEPEEEIPENLVYADEVLQTPQERQQNRTFKKKDAYHLPDLGTSLSAMGGQNDPRIMSLEELEEYARQFDRGEDINVYDFSKIDFDSPFFTSLPAADRYNILNAARLRSRLRMGYSKDQLDTMFPDRMAFSKFQIERVRERNELTQRLMNINGMVDDSMIGINSGARVASEKGREYVLVKNDGVEGGWALGVVTNKEEGQMSKPIDVDAPEEAEEDWESDEDEFEDVPIEGLNRLPKPKPRLTSEQIEGRKFISNELSKRRKALYDSRKDKPAKPRIQKPKAVNEDPDSLFLAEEEDEWENVDVGGTAALFEDGQEDKLDEEEEHLQQAIALSLQQDRRSPAPIETDEDDDYREVFRQKKVEEKSVPFSSAKGSGLAIARLANQRSNKATAKGPFDDSDSDEEDEDVRAAIEEAKAKAKAVAAKERASKKPVPAQPSTSTNPWGFDGPLPFEKLDLGNSILGKKKAQNAEDPNAGGFVKEGEEKESKKPVAPLPPWFTGDTEAQQETGAQNSENSVGEKNKPKSVEGGFEFQELPRLRKQDTQEVIDLVTSQSQASKGEIVTIESSDEEVEMEVVVGPETVPQMNGLEDKVRTDPPAHLSPAREPSIERPVLNVSKEPSIHVSDDEPVEWSESEPETREPVVSSNSAKENEQTSSNSRSRSPEFEDIPLDGPAPASRTRKEHSPAILEGPDELGAIPLPLSGFADDGAPLDLPDNDSEQYSDPEDAELFASLAAEDIEHARFATSINNTAKPINFEEELKQLRTQQKHDRRDADEVTQTMISECQHLLTLFGLPYITAPMEAEAQCAELLNLGLVDGIVTDDSDTFLFGGTRIYKNMFNTAKFVECYLASDLASEFNLTREKLISIAQLLGSDYTPGLPGIGPVTALEILSEFGDLKAFREWWDEIQMQPPSKKPPPEPTAWRRRFRRSQAAKLFLPTIFPDPRVEEAYLKPEVDHDTQEFVWGVPDLGALRSFLSRQVGWSAERTDEVLVPVIRDMNRREKEGTQANITRFFEGTIGAGAFAPRVVGGSGKKGKGARLRGALERMKEREDGGRADVADEVGVAEDGNQRQEDATAAEVEAEQSASGKGKGKKGKKKRKKDTKDDYTDDGSAEGGGSDDDLYTEPRKKVRRTKKR